MTTDGRQISFGLLAAALILRPQAAGAAYPFGEGIFAVLLLLALSLALLLRPGAPPSWRIAFPSVGALALWAGWSFLSLAWSSDTGQGVRESVSLLSQAAAFLLAGLFLSRRPLDLRPWGWLAGGVFAGAFLRVIHQRFLTWNETQDLLAGMGPAGRDLAGTLAGGRAFGGFLNPNLLGGFCAMAIPLFLSFALSGSRGRRTAFALLTAAASGVLLLSGSAGAMVAATAGCALALAPRAGRRGAAIAGGVALLAFGVVLLLRGPGFLWGPDGSLTQRAGYAAAGVRMAQAAPAAGGGIGSVPGALVNFIPPEVRPANDPHDFLVRAWASGGAVGVLLLLLFLATTGRTVVAAWRRTRDPFLLALASSAGAFLIHSLGEMTFTAPETALFGWTLMGGALGRASTLLPPPPLSPPSLRVPGGGAASLAAGSVLLALCLPLALFVQGEVNLFLGERALREGRFPHASAWFRQAEGALPFSGEISLGRGRALAGEGRLADADQALRRASAQLPRSPWPEWEWGLSLARQGSWEEADRHLGAAQERYPSSPWIRIERARLALAQGRREEAGRLLAQARSLSRWDPEAGRAAELLLARMGGEG